jgi:hypothetical protein
MEKRDKYSAHKLSCARCKVSFRDACVTVGWRTAQNRPARPGQGAEG